MEGFLDKIFSLIQSNIGFVPVLGVVYLISMMLFWYEGKLVKKNRNSVFDQWFFTTIVMIIWGRLMYIIAFWENFARWDWFYLPYEKYGDTVYIFRAMPWRLFSIWDGGFLFIPMFFIYLLVSFVFIVFLKRWRWREMMTSVLFSSNFLLSTTLILYGYYIGQIDIAKKGAVILLGVIVAQVFLNSLKLFYNANVEAYVRIGQILVMVFLVIDIWYVSYAFLSQDITQIDRYHVYSFIVLGVVMAIAYLIDFKRGDVISEGSKSHVPKITLNQTIRITE